MDGRFDEVDFLVASIGRSIDDLRDGVLGAGGPHLVRGASLGNYMTAALDGIASRAETLLADAHTAGPNDLDAIGSQLRLFQYHLATLHRCAAWLADTRASSLGLGVIYFFEEAGKTLLPSESELVVRPHHEYGYSTIGMHDPLAAILGDAGAATPTGPRPILINYPALEVDRVLLHPIFVHELGHQAVEQAGLRDEILRRHPELTDLLSRFAEAVKNIEDQHRASGLLVVPGEAASDLRETLNNWIEELACDALAVAYMGPSFLLAAGAFLLLGAKESPSSTHPPSSLRIRWALDALDATGWLDDLRHRIPATIKWLDWAGTPAPAAPGDFFAGFLLEALSELKPVVSSVAQDHLGSDVFLPANYAPSGSQLEALLADHIPPVQLADQTAAGRRAIVLACWLAAFAAAGDHPRSLSLALADIELQRFYARAIEMSFVLERWSEL